MRPLIAILANFGPSGDVVSRPYIEAILGAGGTPVIVPCLDDAEQVGVVLDRTAGLLVTGGDDIAPSRFGEGPHQHLGEVSPRRDTLDELALAHATGRANMPILGICRGVQAMAVFAGGALTQDIPSQVPGALQHAQRAPSFHGSHEIEVTGGTLLAGIVGAERVMTNSFHHQAVSRLPEEYLVSARAADSVIEAIEHPGRAFCLGVQFHPEHMVAHSPAMAAIFARFVAACGA